MGTERAPVRGKKKSARQGGGKESSREVSLRKRCCKLSEEGKREDVPFQGITSENGVPRGPVGSEEMHMGEKKKKKLSVCDVRTMTIAETLNQGVWTRKGRAKGS